MSLGTEKAVLFKSSHIPPPLQLLSIELQAKCVLAVEKKIKAKCESSLQEDNTQLPQFSINITLGITKHHQLYQKNNKNQPSYDRLVPMNCCCNH